MIDLRKKELPSHIEWEGGSCVIDTDFRTWITFGEYLKDQQLYLGVFPNFQAPQGEDWAPALYEFYTCRNIVPRPIGGSNVPAIDMVIDGEFIVASFQQAYGIDLTSIDYMHWHRFKALLAGLPDDTKMSKIIGYRTWTKADSQRKHDDLMQEQRSIWALPLHEDTDEYGGFGALLSALGEI